jgi:hypothetical protein
MMLIFQFYSIIIIQTIFFVSILLQLNQNKYKFCLWSVAIKISF